MKKNNPTLYSLLSSIQKRLDKLTLKEIFASFLIVFLLGSAYFLLNREVEYVTVTMRLMEFSFSDELPKPWYIEQITPGKKQRNVLGKTMIEVLDVYTYPGPAFSYDALVTLRIRSTKDKTSGQYVFDGRPLLIHDVRSFKIEDLLIDGRIEDVHTEEREFKKFEVDLELVTQQNELFSNTSQAIVRGVENHVANVLEKGMTIKDSQNRVIVKILDVESQAGVRTYVGENGYSAILDPEITQVTLKLEILGEEINDHYYYRREAPLIIDQRLHLIFPNVAVLGKITALEQL